MIRQVGIGLGLKSSKVNAFKNTTEYLNIVNLIFKNNNEYKFSYFSELFFSKMGNLSL